MKCIHNVCNKQKGNFTVDEKNAIVPMECDIGNLLQLFTYFQYKAPNIDSAHSPLLDIAYHDEILQKITNGHSDNCFCEQNSNTEKELKKLALNGISICSKCKRFLCKKMTHNAKRDPSRKESNLECLLRHLRNSIAHGHVYIMHGGNFISLLFEDIGSNKKVTARIVCWQADLKKWRKILEEAIKKQDAIRSHIK